MIKARVSDFCQKEDGSLLKDKGGCCGGERLEERGDRAQYEILRLEQLLLQDIRILDRLGDLPARINLLFQDLGAYLQADRIYIFEFDGRKMSNTYEWCREGVSRQIDNLQDMEITDVQRWMSYLLKHETVEVKDIQTIRADYPVEYEVMSKQDIRSYIEAPLVVREKLIGFIGFDNPPVAKFEQLRPILLSLAYFISAAMEREQREEELLHRMKELRRASREAEAANNAKTEFLATVSHDLRTPMNAVLGYCQLALETDLQNEKDAYLKKISIAGASLLALINDTLDFQKLETGQISLNPEGARESALLERIATAVSPMMQAKQLQFIVNGEKLYKGPVLVDVLKVEEIFINLLSNAAKYTPAGGRVEFWAETLRLEEDYVHDRVVVRDTGIGISREFLPKIYEPFLQERVKQTIGQEGSGLGLSIVKRLVNMMGGRIEVQSQLGQGTQFAVYLSFRRYNQPEPQQPGGRTAVDLAGTRVLLCEDNKMNQEICAAILGKKQMTVDIAANGREGLDRFTASAPAAYDIILMDLRMPEMDGFEATRAIRSSSHPQARSIPIVAVTADAYREDLKRCLEVGMNAHVAKPLNVPQLLETMAKVLKKEDGKRDLCYNNY